MLAALNVVAVGLGIGAGGLTATVVALILGGSLSLLRVEDGAEIGLVVGVLAGLVTAGWVAGRMARHSARFHGAVTGLLLAGLIVLVARVGGSPAPATTVAWLSLLSATVAGLSGWWAGIRKQKRS